jgi:hypothetical protein
MERKLWLTLYKAALGIAYDPGPRCEPEHDDRIIVAVYLWAVIHDRPTDWACRRSHWPDRLMPRPLPSQPTMSRRLRTAAVRRLLNALLRPYRRPWWVRCLDSKPLAVGGCTKDPDARPGRSTGGWFRGYELHAIWGPGPAPDAWEVLPADRGEPTAARLLVPRCGGRGYLLGDSSYDSNPLHAAASRRRLQVVARPKKADRGLGHRAHAAGRLRSRELLRPPWCGPPFPAGARPFGVALYAHRAAIERSFGRLTCFGGGLGPLPAWVRRLWRVRLWVQAKLLINAARIEALDHDHLVA